MLGITYSEFDNIVGPKLEYTYPPDVLSAETFETLSDYAIVGSHLSKKSIVVKTEEIQFLSYSVAINKPKYFRNTLLFSCGVVLERNADIEPYEPLLRKLSSSLVALELEQEFLFKKSIKDERLPQLLRDIFESCIARGEAFVEMDAANYLAFKLYSPVEQPRQLGEYEVPMLLYDRQLTANLPWDITLHHILPKIDGTTYIKRIAEGSKMDVETVVKALRTLLFYKCILLTDIFRFNNVYQLRPDAARRLLNEPALLEELEQFSLVLPFNVNDPDGINNVVQQYSSGSSGSSGIGGNNANGGDLGSANRSRSTSMNVETFESSALGAIGTGGGLGQGSNSMNTNTSSNSNSNSNSNTALPSRIPGILRLLLRLRPDRTIAQAIFGEHYRNTQTEKVEDNEEQRRQINLSKYLVNIDVRRLIAMAQEKKIVQRLYEFPVRGGVSEVVSFKGGEGDIRPEDFNTLESMRAAGQNWSAASDSEPTSYYPYGEVTDDDYEDRVADFHVESKSTRSDSVHFLSGSPSRNGRSSPNRGPTPTVTSPQLVHAKLRKSLHHYHRGEKDMAVGLKPNNNKKGSSKARQKQVSSTDADDDGSRVSDDEDYLFMADEFLRTEETSSPDSPDEEEEGEDDEGSGGFGESDSDGSRDSHSSGSTGSSSSSSSSDSGTSVSDSSSDGGSDNEQQVDDAVNTRARKLQEQKLINHLHGAESLDALCCAHELAPSVILGTSHMFVPYKASSLRR